MIASSSHDPPVDVICVGLIVADHICAPIPAIPPPGGLVTTERLELSIGGCAANVSVDLAKLDVPVALVGRVGEDVFGRAVREDLEAGGVSCGHVSVSHTAQTSGTMVVNVRGEDRRFIHAVGANAELTGREVTDELLGQAKVVYVGGFGLNPALSGENVAEMFRRARERSVTTILDVVIDDPRAALEMARIALPETDIFLPNADEARMMTGLEDPRDQAEYFSKLGSRTVVITMGERGVLLREESGRMLTAPAHQVEQVDGTGGGDAFVAGFIYGLLKGLPVEECLVYGSAVGASCVQAAGATTGVFEASQLEQFVQQNPLEIRTT
jgi:ribokinase